MIKPIHLFILFGILLFGTLNPNQVCNHKVHAAPNLFNDELDSFNLASIEQDEVKPKGVDTIITWRMLSNVRYVKKDHPEYGLVYEPVYGKSLKALDGKIVMIKGFIIPLDLKEYVLSKNVYANCFFCGQAGAETILGVHFKKIPKGLKTDMYVSLKGKFELNYSNPDDWMYHLREAVLLEIK